MARKMYWIMFLFMISSCEDHRFSNTIKPATPLPTAYKLKLEFDHAKLYEFDGVENKNCYLAVGGHGSTTSASVFCY